MCSVSASKWLDPVCIATKSQQHLCKEPTRHLNSGKYELLKSSTKNTKLRVTTYQTPCKYQTPCQVTHLFRCAWESAPPVSAQYWFVRGNSWGHPTSRPVRASARHLCLLPWLQRSLQSRAPAGHGWPLLTTAADKTLRLVLQNSSYNFNPRKQKIFRDSANKRGRSRASERTRCLVANALAVLALAIEAGRQGFKQSSQECATQSIRAIYLQNNAKIFCRVEQISRLLSTSDGGTRQSWQCWQAWCRHSIVTFNQQRQCHRLIGV